MSDPEAVDLARRSQEAMKDPYLADQIGEAWKDVKDDLDPTQFARELRGDWLPQFGDAPEPGASFYSDYESLYRQHFQATGGNNDVAKRLAENDMRRMYHVSNADGRDVIRKYPPELKYPDTVDMDDNWIAGAFDDVTANLPHSAPGTKWILVSDAETMSTQGGSWKVAEVYEDGGFTGEEAPERFVPDPAEYFVHEYERAQAEADRLYEKQRKLEAGSIYDDVGRSGGFAGRLSLSRTARDRRELRKVNTQIAAREQEAGEALADASTVTAGPRF